MIFKSYSRCIYTSATIWSTKQPLGVTHSADDNFYSILNVKRTANQSEIKKAYYEQSKKFHPDKNPSEDAKKVYNDVKEAYEVLSDKSKKQSYDQFLDKLIRGKKYLPRKKTNKPNLHRKEFMEKFNDPEYDFNLKTGKWEKNTDDDDLGINWMEVVRTSKYNKSDTLHLDNKQYKKFEGRIFRMFDKIFPSSETSMSGEKEEISANEFNRRLKRSVILFAILFLIPGLVIENQNQPQYFRHPQKKNDSKQNSKECRDSISTQN